MQEILVPTFKLLIERHTSKQVAFRPFTRSDIFPLFVATRNPRFNEYLLWPAPDTMQSLVPWLEKLLGAALANEMAVCSACEKDSGRWLGMLLVKRYRDGAEIGLALHPDVWSRRVVFALGDALIGVLSENFPALPIYCRVNPANHRMERVCGYYGFEVVDHEKAPRTTGEEVNFGVWKRRHDAPPCRPLDIF